MPRNPRRYCLVEDGYYHVITRGNNKKAIFREHDDYLQLKKYLKHYKKEYVTKVVAYCLMPNHYHVLLKSGPDLSALMRVINTQYAKYFNKKYGLHGHLFGDRYKSYLVADNPYMITLIRYIHGNPVRANLVEDPLHYSYSSLKEYLKNGDLIDKKVIEALMDNTVVGTVMAQILS